MPAYEKYESVNFHVLDWQSSPIFPDVRQNARIVDPRVMTTFKKF